jgi:hypothetical protein
MGARLCTPAEITASPREMSARTCGYYYEWVWTSTECVSKQFQLAYMQATDASRCFSAATDDKMVTRCCSDDSVSTDNGIDEGAGTDNSSASAGGFSSPMSVTIILLVMILVVLIVVVVVVVVINKTRPQKQVQDKVDYLEIRPQIFFEEKNTVNPMLTREGGDGRGSDADLKWQAIVNGTDNDMDMTMEWDPITSPGSPYLNPALDLDEMERQERHPRSSVMLWMAPPPEDVSVGAGSEVGVKPAVRGVKTQQLEWEDGLPGSSGTSSAGGGNSTSNLSSVSSVRARVQALEQGRLDPTTRLLGDGQITSCST